MIFATRLWRRTAIVMSIAAGLTVNLLAVAGYAQTAGPDIYAVSGINVDVVAESAVKARELAMEEAQREGLRRLLERLTSAEYYTSLPPLGGISLGRVVRSIEVDDEQVAATRYVASISVVYDEVAIQAVLQSAGVPSVLTPSEPILIVPMLQNAGSVGLWDQAGAWRDAWWEEVDRNTVLRLVLPLGDLADVTTLKPTEPGGDVQEMLAAIADRYGAEAAIVARATPEPVDADVQPLPTATEAAAEETGPAAIEVDVPYRWNWPFDVAVLEVTAADPADQVWQDGVRAIITALEKEWKRAHLIRYDQVSSIVADVPIDRLEGWIEIRRSLLELPEIRSVSIDSFSQIGAAVTIQHIGDMARLGQGLERRGLELRLAGGRWQLRPLSRELPLSNDLSLPTTISPATSSTPPAPATEN